MDGKLAIPLLLGGAALLLSASVAGQVGRSQRGFALRMEAGPDPGVLVAAALTDATAPLAWSDPPPGTAALALVARDARAGGRPLWAIWGLPPAAGRLRDAAPGARRSGGAHRPRLGSLLARQVSIDLFALRRPLRLPDGAPAGAVLDAARREALAGAALRLGAGWWWPESGRSAGRRFGVTGGEVDRERPPAPEQEE